MKINWPLFGIAVVVLAIFILLPKILKGSLDAAGSGVSDVLGNLGSGAAKGVTNFVGGLAGSIEETASSSIQTLKGYLFGGAAQAAENTVNEAQVAQSTGGAGVVATMDAMQTKVMF
jgi:hypothetical protein